MSLLAALASQLLHLALMVTAAPVLLGFVRWTEARLVGRIGPSPLQPWRDLRRLGRKQPVVAENASPLFLAAPIVQFAAVAAAALLVPSFALGMSSGPVADLLLIFGLLTLERCTSSLAAMDVGTAFGGLGASRSMTFGVFVEPALVLVLFSFAWLAGSTNLDTIAAALREGALAPSVSLALVAVATVGVALTEVGRLPVGNPLERFELGMVRDAMTLEYSGRDLALIEGTAGLKLLLWLTLVCALFVPFGVAPAGAGPIAWLIGLGCWALKIGALAMALALFETARAKMRLVRVPAFLGVALLFGLLAAAWLLVSQGLA